MFNIRMIRTSRTDLTSICPEVMCCPIGARRDDRGAGRHEAERRGSVVVCGSTVILSLNMASLNYDIGMDRNLFVDKVGIGKKFGCMNQMVCNVIQ